MNLRKQTVKAPVSKRTELTEITLNPTEAESIKTSLLTLADELDHEITLMAASRFSSSAFTRFASYGKLVEIKSLPTTLRDAANLFRFDMSQDEIEKFNEYSSS